MALKLAKIVARWPLVLISIGLALTLAWLVLLIFLPLRLLQMV